MAKTISEEEIRLRKRARRRLVGAITLVIAAVVILPMVLDTKPELRTHEIDIRIPSEDSVEELGAESASSTETSVAAIPSPPRAETEIQREEQLTSGQNATAPQSGEGREPVGESDRITAAITAASEAFVVQLGAFSAPAKAKQLSQKLAPKNITAYTETVKSGKDEITRVRVGPFDTREEAEKTREKLKKQGFEGVVTEK